MKYNIYFYERPSTYFETVEAQTYKSDSDFITFYYDCLPVGFTVNVASYRTPTIAKVVLAEDTTQKMREKKLKRILNKDNKIKKIWNIIIGK